PRRDRELDSTPEIRSFKVYHLHMWQRLLGMLSTFFGRLPPTRPEDRGGGRGPSQKGRHLMADYTFRIRFLLPRDAGLTCADSSVEVAPPGYPANLTLKSHNGTPISDSHDLVLQSSGWPSEQEAKEAGERAMVALALALADLGLGSFVGDRGGPRGMF